MSIWPLTIGITSSALLGSTVFCNSLNKAVFGDVKKDWLNNEVDFDHISNDKRTVVCKSGLLFRVYELVGEAYDTKPYDSQVNLSNKRSVLINEFAALDITARFYGVKRLKDISHNAVWPSPVLQEIGEAEKENFKRAYEIKWFMVLSAKNFKVLEDINEKIFSIFKTYKPKVLTTVEDKTKACPLTCFLNYLMCGDFRTDLRAVSHNITANLQASDTIWDKEAGTMIAHSPTPYIYKGVSIQLWGDVADGQIINNITKIKGEIEVSQVILPIKKEFNSLLFSKKEKEANGFMFGNKTLAGECEFALSMISDGETSFFNTQFNINVRAKTMRELDDILLQITSSMAKDGIRYVVETETFAPSWFNRVPGHDVLSRPLKITNENLASIWCWQFSPTGLQTSYWGNAPVRSFKTASGGAYAFQFQATNAKKALGNFVVFAPSGVGKSTLMMHLFGGLSKFDNQKTFIFDSKNGAQFMIEAMGGVYQSYDKLALNPLDVKEDTPQVRQNMSRMLKTMIGNIDAAEDIDDLVSHVLDVSFEQPLGQRTFNEIFDIGFSKGKVSKKAFSKWVKSSKGKSGHYSHIFNSPYDSLSDFLTGSFMVGINMNEALEDKELSAPVVTHISSAIERIANSGDLDGFAIFIDEAANLLQNDAFKTHAKQMYREYRKLGGATGMAFQDPSALFKSGIADAVIENTSSMFFFPNPQGNHEAYEPFNLNEEQKEFIWGGDMESRKVLLVKRDAGTGFEESVILDVDLSILGDSLKYYQSGSDAVRQMENLKKQWGETWYEHLK
jgi:type IV secretion system protein VirB4